MVAHIRGEIWMHLSGGFSALDQSPLLYQSLLNTHYDIEIGWYFMLRVQFDHVWFSFIFSTKIPNFLFFLNTPVEAIRIDLPRTFPENVFFENIRTPLFNVLVAYANHNKEIGYCQGLNYIAGE